MNQDHPKAAPLRVLFLVPSDLAALRRKRVEHMIEERCENGQIEYCVTVHPFGTEPFTLDINDRHKLYEYSLSEPARALPRPLGWIRYMLYLIQMVRRVRQLIRDHRINVVRAQDPYYMGLIGWLATRSKPAAHFCVSLHADYDKRYELDGARGGTAIFGSRKLAKRLERLILGSAERVLPIRQSIGDKVVELGVDEQRLSIIPHGIDLGLFTSPNPKIDIYDRFDLPGGATIVSFAGRFSHDNYIDDILDIARKAAVIPNLRFVLAGDGDQKKRIEEIVAAEPTLGESVIFTGPITREEIAALRQASTASLVPMGGFSLIEACAAASPVISYDIEWHHELVLSGKTGYLIDEGDTDAAVEAIRALIDNPETARAMGLRAREIACSRHGREQASAAKVSAYRAML